jgi:type VI secretion system protein ImpG
LSEQTNEYHIVVDRSRPLDYEVHSLIEVEGFGMRSEPEQVFLPFYACNDADRDRFHDAYYTLHREPRMLSSRQRRVGTRSSYVGSEVWVGLVDAGAAPFRSQLRQLGVSVLCSNRDLPLQMPVGTGSTDLTLEIGAPVQSVRFLAGPTEPWPSSASRDVAWKLISHLSLNYLSLLDDQDGRGAAALRELLDLYVPRKPGDGNLVPSTRIEALLSVASRPIHRRLPLPGPPAIGRGLEITVTVDETGFAGSGPFLLGQVLEQFFARYVSINAFTETVLRSVSRGEIKRWPARPGRRTLS